MEKISLADYEKLTPFGKGYVSYWQGTWNKDIPETCPFPEGSSDRLAFMKGQHTARVEADERGIDVELED
jgi:hypothetical protein